MLSTSGTGRATSPVSVADLPDLRARQGRLAAPGGGQADRLQGRPKCWAPGIAFGSQQVLRVGVIGQEAPYHIRNGIAFAHDRRRPLTALEVRQFAALHGAHALLEVIGLAQPDLLGQLAGNGGVEFG